MDGLNTTTAETMTAVLSLRIIPVVVLDDAASAGPLADALIAGGLPCAEVTLRSARALDVLRAMAAIPGLIVGGGTVCTADQARRCIDAGAAFLVSPGLAETVVEAAREADVPVVPGVATPTEILHAIDLGLSTLKLFPASVIGGPPAVRALSGPFPHLQFVPTGGIDEASARDYLSLPSVPAIGGSWMVAPALLSTRDFGEVQRRASAARKLVASLDA